MIYEGSFTLHRKIFKHWLSPVMQERKFSPLEAWLWMIAHAYFVCAKKTIHGEEVIIPRGSFYTTNVWLAEVWKWDRRTVEKFLKKLESMYMISRGKCTRQNRCACTLVKITNYDRFQPTLETECTSECKINCEKTCTLHKKNIHKKGLHKNTHMGFLKNFFGSGGVNELVEQFDFS